MRLSKTAALLALSYALLGCAAPVETAGPIAQDDEDVATASSALSSDSLPDEVDLVDMTIDGIEERVFTGHGFVFRASAQSWGGTAFIENHSASTLAANISVGAMCVHAGAIYFPRSNTATVILRKGAAPRSLSSNCNSGDTAQQVAVAFTDITSDAPDIGYQDSGLARNGSLMSQVGFNAAPNAYINLGAGLLFKQKLRATWGSAEYINNGTSWVTVKNVFVQIFCSGPGPAIKKVWGPMSVGPGQAMTSTVGCPAGQTVDAVMTSFLR